MIPTFDEDLDATIALLREAILVLNRQEKALKAYSAELPGYLARTSKGEDIEHRSSEISFAAFQLQEVINDLTKVK